MILSIAQYQGYLLISHAVSWFWTDWQGVRDDKIIAVCAEDPEHCHYKDIKSFHLIELRKFVDFLRTVS